MMSFTSLILSWIKPQLTELTAWLPRPDDLPDAVSQRSKPFHKTLFVQG